MKNDKNIAFCVYGKTGTEMYYNTIREFDNTNMKFAITRSDDNVLYVNAVNQLSQRREIRFATLELNDYDNLAALCRQYKITYLFLFDWPEHYYGHGYENYFMNAGLQDDFTIVKIARGYPPSTYGMYSHIDAIKKNLNYGVCITTQNSPYEEKVIYKKKMKIKPTETGLTLLRRSSIWSINFIHEHYLDIVEANPTRILHTIHDTDIDRYYEEWIPSEIKLNKMYRAGDLIGLIRAETMKAHDSSSYFEHKGKMYKIRLEIEEENEN